MIYQALVAKTLIVPYRKAHLLNEAIQASPLGISLLNAKGEILPPIPLMRV